MLVLGAKVSLLKGIKLENVQCDGLAAPSMGKGPTAPALVRLAV